VPGPPTFVLARPSSGLAHKRWRPARLTSVRAAYGRDVTGLRAACGRDVTGRRVGGVSAGIELIKNEK
jgi:hypothetical protein